MVGVVNLVDLVFSLVAAAKARNGLLYYFIFFGRISYQQAFSRKQKPERKLINEPPKM
jgi:hypothetical protein